MALNRFQPENSNKYRGYMPLVDGIDVYKVHDNESLLMTHKLWVINYDLTQYFKEQTDFGNDGFERNNPEENPLKKFMEEKSSYLGNQKFESIMRKNYEIYSLGAALILDRVSWIYQSSRDSPGLSSKRARKSVDPGIKKCVRLGSIFLLIILR